MRSDILRSYGRRKGHKISPHREALFDDLLPSLRVDTAQDRPSSAASLFGFPCRDVWLEIGFGNGEHLAEQARRNPDVGFVGAEPFLNGVSTLLAAIDHEDLQNIRLLDDDVRPLLDWLPTHSIGRVFILFPDPWPKKRHHKRRLVGTPLLDQLSQVMKPGAELRIASDIGDYLRTTLLAVQAHPLFEWLDTGPSDWRVRSEDWPQTRYEQKAIEAGRRCAYLSVKHIGGEKEDCS